RWSARGLDGYRSVQIATGVYLGFFLLAHMNSALVSARLLNNIDTDWAWASNAPVGLLKDAWSIRLLPHYALGAVCALAHLAGGAAATVAGWPGSAAERRRTRRGSGVSGARTRRAAAPAPRCTAGRSPRRG